MNKSHLGTADNPQEVVTAHDIGRLVDVVNVGKGFLRYVGPIHGKDGMFCGIELLEPNGKHDGTFQGVSYFIATPYHGIFAPIFRVTLDAEELPKPPPPNPSNFSNGSWSDIADSMITSNCTFTVRKGLPIDDDGDLMSVPMVQSVFNIDREALRREEQLQSSIVLGESRIGVEHLPIIEDENELETPLVETRTMPLPNDLNANFSNKNSTTTFVEPETPKVEIRENGNLDNSIETPPQQSPSGSSMVSHESDSSSKKDDTKSDKSPTKKSQKMEEKPVVKKKEEPAAPPPPPKFPVKQKAPSKHQLMMEQLKASIEAEKTKPKKEIKSRVSLLPPPAPKAPQKENKEGGEMTETPRRTITKTPLKTVNAKAKTSPTPPVERQKKERKPLYVAPPAKERVEKEKKIPSKPVVSPPTTAEKKPVVSSIPSTSSASKGPFPTSSFAGGKLQGPRKTSSSSTTTSAKKQKNPPIDEKEKLSRLQHSTHAFEATLIVMNRINEDNERKLGNISEQYEKKVSELGDLKKMLDEARKKFEEDVEQMKNSNQQVIRNHANAVESLQKTHETQIAEKNKEFERNFEEERARREAEVCAMNNRHQKVVACLDEKISEAEKQCEQLNVDKKVLQAALANDCDHRNQMLTKEISSLQTALEMKSAEMKELRQKNQNLSLQVDEIPLKELEISKWKHKSNEYKQMLDQKINGEKILVQQIEDLRRKQIHDEEEKEAMKRSFDLMQFKYENGDDPNVTSVMSAPMESRFSTPTKVQFRSRSSASGSRPISMATSNGGDQRLSTSSHHDDSMNRSTISMYTSHIRLPENHADDVIYAPDEIISSRSGSISQRLAISIENDGEPTIKSESSRIGNTSDSGIGLVM
ncbi:CAP-Gly domain-containing linker protein 1 homolog [Caenorhabditis elegans]|uniref:Isoform b of CAP-Gly domain-containing linker protein 1 homolog n=1 Tax=Caenorhabditis elegans TaxID=6239 RepID=P34531-2|nr:CAP-Gly domain-containing linker protein 1 homolog [Caenorhabditis elegans]CAH19085.1 CAP-Gly domain-containing linker protein 1 homolog [Caenorhabditis elegans]|eukprot:NP_001022683.1 CAP-Gly domain-containing linker protein 1 homolog [Caenorhabditis elegans]